MDDLLMHYVYERILVADPGSRGIPLENDQRY
jgi:hypothetical protein